MSKTALIYASKYGATKKDAIHIAAQTGADLYELKKKFTFDFSRYDTIIFGGGLYAGKLNGAKFLEQNVSELAGKKVVLFSCGLADPTIAVEAQQTAKDISKSLPEQLKNTVHSFQLRGKIDYANLSFVHKMMMSMLNNMLKKKDREKLATTQIDMIENYGGVLDYTNLALAQPLIDYVCSITNK